MDKTADEFLKRLLATFKVEAAEHLRALSAGLMELEKAGDPEERKGVVETVFREAHSLKGAARAVSKREIEILCQAAESVFSALKGGKIELSPALLDLLHEAADTLDELLAALDRGGPGGGKAGVTGLCARLNDAAAGEPPAPAPAKAGEPSPRAGATWSELPAVEPLRTGDQAPTPPPEAQVPAALPSGGVESVQTRATGGAEEVSTVTETVRISVSRLDAVLFQAEALLGAKLSAQQRSADLRDMLGAFGELKKARAKVAPDVKAVQRALDRTEVRDNGRAVAKADPRVRKLVEWMVWEDTFLKSFESRLAELSRLAEQGMRSLGGTVDGLLDDVKKALMLPVASAVEVLPKVVRDLSREQGKEVDFEMTGSEIEIDRRILEEIRDPLLHLVRNCLDHGIEKPEARLAAGKPRRGAITFTASQIEGGRIEIQVADDGAGIDLNKIRAAAHKQGLAANEETDSERLLSLVFQSGFSTSPLITDISGRGLGLAIVREKVERLGGTVAVETQVGVGTAFRIELPLTLATFRGVRVRAGGLEFIFPTTYLEQVLRVDRHDIKTVENRETVPIGGRAVALVKLREVLEVVDGAASRDEAAGDAIVVAVANAGERRVAFEIDEVVAEQEVLMKSLGRQLVRVRNVAGAAVLGSGKVVPVLHVPDLMKSARRIARAPAAALPAPSPVAAGDGHKSILVAEDSITSRMLLKGILESAGYAVTTAVDGADAYARLHTEPFDLLVSDVDMPRMNGFDLTARVRQDRQLAHLPVVLVTSLGSQEHRERGADAGANAYIVKSSFDQSNLLAAIRRLL